MKKQPSDFKTLSTASDQIHKMIVSFTSAPSTGILARSYMHLRNIPPQRRHKFPAGIYGSVLCLAAVKAARCARPLTDRASSIRQALRWHDFLAAGAFAQRGRVFLLCSALDKQAGSEPCTQQATCVACVRRGSAKLCMRKHTAKPYNNINCQVVIWSPEQRKKLGILLGIGRRFYT